MKLYDLIISRRTIREFQNKPISRKMLKQFVNAGRLAPQAANRQPLEFVVIDDPNICGEIFPLVKLAGYLEWKPAAEKQPAAYIAIVANKELQKPTWIPYDVALASGNICLAAWEEGIGSCMIGAFNKGKIDELLKLPEGHNLTLLVALGYPDQTSVAEEMETDSVKYWRDENGNFHVPKRSLDKVTHYNKF